MRKSNVVKAMACFMAATMAITCVPSGNITNGVSMVAEAAEDGTETLTGTKWWEGSQKGKDYTLSGDGKIVLEVEAKELVKDVDNAFSVELQSGKHYLTTGSDKNAWTAEEAANNGVIGGVANPLKSDLIEGHIYKITITRLGQNFTVEYYDDTTKEEYCTLTLKNSNFPESDVNVHIIAQIGTYVVREYIAENPCSDIGARSECGRSGQAPRSGARPDIPG